MKKCGGRPQYNPYEDIAIDTEGAWRWNSDKPEMQQGVREHLIAKQEDG